MQQLSGLDASFLYLETSNAPMHIGGVSILDPSTPRGRLELEDLLELLGSRCHTSRAFTQKLVEVPWKLGRPYWIQDEHFDLAKHVHRTQLPEPGNWKELAALASCRCTSSARARRNSTFAVFSLGIPIAAAISAYGIRQ